LDAFINLGENQLDKIKEQILEADKAIDQSLRIVEYLGESKSCATATRVKK
jgi:hypothetical protein